MSRFALVPVEAQGVMLTVGIENVRRNYPSMGEYCLDLAFAAMVAASPDNAILAEILAARDDYKSACEKCDLPLMLLVRRDLMAALDKLGPAGEVEG